MLVYDNEERLRLLFNASGSVVLSNCPVSILSALVAVALDYIFSEYEDELELVRSLKGDWAISTVGIGMSFAIVFRTQIAWNRYWEAAQEVTTMWSKWGDSFMNMISFGNSEHYRLYEQAKSIVPGEDGLSEADRRAYEQLNSTLQKVYHVRYSLAHDLSLLSAFACYRLTHGDLLRMRRRSMKFGTRGAGVRWLCRLWKNWNELMVPRQLLRYNDATGAGNMPRLQSFELQELEVDVKAKMLRRKPTFRQRLSQGLSAISSEDTQDSQKTTAYDLTWSSDLCILGGMAPHEYMALEKPHEMVTSMSGPIEVLDEEAGPSDDSPCIIQADPSVSELAPVDSLAARLSASQREKNVVPDRVAIIAEWVFEDFNALARHVDIPAPIISRAYQEMSSGLLGFSQACKMADFPFPFPFAQLLEWLLVAYTLVIPLFATVFTGSVAVAPFLAFLATLCFWTLTSISRVLENPVADGPNQLPVIDMHERFVDMLRSVYHTRRPDYPANSKTSFLEGPCSLDLSPTERASRAFDVTGSVGEPGSRRGSVRSARSFTSRGSNGNASDGDAHDFKVPSGYGFNRRGSAASNASRPSMRASNGRRPSPGSHGGLQGGTSRNSPVKGDLKEVSWSNDADGSYQSI
jgi:predicted membrane chloride channel (bestrophin family)